MTSLIDSSRQVRPGEELDLVKLEPYLRERIPSASAGALSLDQFPSGYSNLTYLIRLGDQELVLRRPPFGNQVKHAHDMGREFKVLSALSKIYEPAPKPYLYCEDESVIGAPFYVMERRRGVILRKEHTPDLELSNELARRLSEAMLDNLVVIHSLDYKSVGLSELGMPEGYVERQVKGWAKRYLNSQTEDVPAMHQLADWLDKNRPAETTACLIHNDYKYDNVLLDAQDLTKIVGVLDWEMATIGDPLMDLGTTLAYWIQANDADIFKFFVVGPTTHLGSLTRKELAHRYAEKTGADISNILFYYTFGIYKLAVIMQQIYARYAKGLTKDERFAHLNMVVGMMAQGGIATLESGSI